MRFSTMAALMCAATAAVGSVQAQTPSQPPAAGSNPVMITGCVTRADMSHASGVNGVTGRDVNTGGEADKFVLTNTRISGAATTQRNSDDKRVTSPAVTSGSTDALAMDAPRYSLEGQSADLRQHLGHQVEITGRWAMANDVRTGTVGTSGRSTTAAETGASGTTVGSSSPNNNGALVSGQVLQVQSVRMIAATCTVK